MLALGFQTAWIVGASTGIGAELARRLAANGCRVVVSARQTGKLEDLAAEASSDRMTAVTADVTDEASITEAWAAARQTLQGPPDLLVFNAGLFSPVDVRKFSAALFRQHIEVNLMGAARVLEHVLPDMIARGDGRIVLVGSVSGYRGLPKAAAYGASKAALIHLAETLRLEMDPAGIMVQIVNPGFIDTPMTTQNDFPMPHLMTIERAVDAFIAGLRSSSFEITFPKRFTWQLKLLRLLPYWLYFRIIRRITRPDRGAKSV
ncbi:MAG: SDR family NAD(P)-dependent oxidoreductase [Rhodospirillaceae bacterium]|nr:SDR family NAD(P)-dependent oxidoreductase [Rhodospirillaceae bacterium]